MQELELLVKMKKPLFIASVFFAFFISTVGFGQRIDEQIDDLTYAWDVEAEKLSSYEGLIEFCQDKEYRFATINLFKEIHHLDSLLYDRLVTASRRGSHDHEIQKTLRDIEEFESKYTTKNFVHFLHEECMESEDLELHSDDLRKDTGVGSYDNRVYILEVELGRYVHHVTKKIDQIREHVHHLRNQ